MAITFTTASQQRIVLHDKPFASGGEGSVHKIISPAWFHNDCVKIYFRQNRTKQREDKIGFMVHNPPPNLGGGNSTRIICWPKEVVYDDNKRVAGFVMPLAFNGSRLLYELCTPNMKNLPPIWTGKYDRATGQGVEGRLKLCVNIAAAVNHIHQARRYVLVDLKPQNLLVTSDGKMSVIDLDSIQISNGNTLVFPAQFATPEYVPVEANAVNPSKNFISDSWDHFSLAVIFYQLLFGLHPYAASFQGRYKDSTTLADSIKNGLFVFGTKGNYVHVRPELHDNFSRIPSSLQSLFIKAFDAGHTNPSLRPSASQWGETTFEELQKPANGWKAMKPAASMRARGKFRTSRQAITTKPLGQPVSFVTPQTSARATTGSTTPAPSPPFPMKALVSVVIAGVLLLLAISFCSQLSKKSSTRTYQPVSSRIVSVSTMNLNLRSGPGVHYSVLMVLPQGTQVTAFDDTRYADRATWVRVRVGSQEGWLNQEYLR